MTAATYLRVSGDGQIAGDGFPRQREACQRYALVQNLEIVQEFRDEGVTGKMELEGRAGLSACLEYVRTNGIGIVLCESSDRLARDMIIAEVIIREFQKIGVKVIAAGSGIDLTEGNDSNPTAKLIRQILAAVAEFDRCVTVLKLREARQRRKKKIGKGEGRHAFGEKPGEDLTLTMMYAFRNDKLTCREIAFELNEHSRPTRSGKPWRGSVVAKILGRKTHRLAQELPHD